MENYETHCQLLNLPPWAFPIAMLCFGYYPAGERPAPRSRFAPKYIVFENEYRRLSSNELNMMFHEMGKTFALNNPYKSENLAQLMYPRIPTPRHTLS